MERSWHFENARVLKDDFTFEVTSLTVRDGVIEGIGGPCPEGARRVDAAGKNLIPGLIDTHFHGALGNCFGRTDASGIRTVAAFEAAQGITSIIPAVSATADENIFASLAAVQEAMSAPTGGARVEGIHLEGPFLSKNYRGGQWERYLQTPSVEKLRHYYEASGGALRIMTLAPECENGLDVVREAKNLGVAIALGHTGADFDTAKAAVDCGASLSTHTFNGMVPFHHRTPGVLGEVLTDDRVSCEVIADFVHLHPATILLICRAKGMDRVHLVSDSMFATGLPDGDYPEEDRVRHIRNGACVLDDGRISGSTYPVAFGMRNLVKIGIPLEQAVMAASRNPARDAGILGHTGTLTPGKRADLVLLKEDLFPAATFVDGEPVFTAEGVRL